MKKVFSFLTLLFSTIFCLQSQETKILYFTGQGKDDPVEWDFFCTDGRKSGTWTKIGVPSCWELQGFGTYNYGHDPSNKKEEGLYKKSIQLPAGWSDKTVFIVFEGSMTDTEVKVNGEIAGPVHQGAFYRFQYDITKLVHVGDDNLFEIRVSKVSSNESVNMAERRADYWVFGGIYRPVFLKAVPENHIVRIAIDARADGTFNMDVYHHLKENGYILEAQIQTTGDEPVGKVFSANALTDKGVTSLNTMIENPELWSPEFPNLYKVKIRLTKDGDTIYQTTERFGFRTVELRRQDGIYVNGEKIIFKGVNRHSFWPESGRTTSKSLSIRDVLLMKEMNMNAVRMSHYPPDVHFLDACDSLGLFVLDELAGWQKPPYDTEIGKKLVKEMVIRDVNHPSIVLWDNGNEGGWNIELDKEFARYDIQKRHVIHPREIFDGTDTQHYKSYNYGNGTFFHGKEIFFPTEFLHGLYDGGLGAGLEDYWNLMLDHPLSAGGFLWCFIDEGVIRTDLNDSIDTDKNHAPDGIMGPYREKEGSFYAIKEIWSPVHIGLDQLPPGFDGNLTITNRYIYTNLSQCSFTVKLSRFMTPFDTGRDLLSEEEPRSLIPPDIPNGETGMINLELPPDWKDYDILYFTAKDPYGRNIFTWSWPVKSPAEFSAKQINIGKQENLISINDEDESIIVETDRVSLRFSKQNGLLTEVMFDGRMIPLRNGPVIHSTHEAQFRDIEYELNEKAAIVRVNYKDELDRVTWKIGSELIQLDYQYRLNGTYDYSGISFSFPEDLVTGVKYVGNGPYRVWKNRMKGSQFGLWEKKYNNTVTGQSWDYPEFKGYYSNFYAVLIENDIHPFRILSATEDIFLHLFTPDPPQWAPNEYTVPPFPEGDISFLHAIPPIGTKFHLPTDLGPSGQPNSFFPSGVPPVNKGTVYIQFQ
jgi:hypothetical protein